MSKNRIKVLAVALAAGFLLQSTSVTADELGFVTTTVERGTISVTSQTNVSVEYPHREPIVFYSGYGSASFVKYYVDRYDMVEEGDPIAEIYTFVDDIDYEELCLDLERARQERDDFYVKYEKEIAQAEENIEKAGSEREKKLARFEWELCKIDLDSTKEELDRKVEQLEERMESIEEAKETTQILAPATGSVGRLQSYWPWETIYNGTVLGEIYLVDEPIFSVQDLTGILRYGMKIDIEDSKGNHYEGTVVSCSKRYLSDGFAKDDAYIQMEELPEQLSNMTAHYETMRIENVLIVDSKAVKTDNDGSYVMVLADGKLMKRYFVAGRSTNGKCYVVDGLDEGMTVVIN